MITNERQDKTDLCLNRHDLHESMPKNQTILLLQYQGTLSINHKNISYIFF